MSVYYFIQKKQNPKDPSQFKFYPTLKSIGHITKKVLVEDMVRNTSLTRQEAETGIDYLFEAFPRFLELGYTVQLGELGYFRLTFNSEGSDTAEEVSRDKIKKTRLRFICGRNIRDLINKFSIEKFPTVTHAE